MIIGWRAIFSSTGVVGLIMAVTCFFYRGKGLPTGALRTKGSGFAQSKASYLRVLKNRNMMAISGVMMVGAAAGDDVNQTYLGPHMVNDLGLAVTAGGAGAGADPGWRHHRFDNAGLGSDRVSRKWVLQGSLLFSALTTWWLAYSGTERAAVANQPADPRGRDRLAQ